MTNQPQAPTVPDPFAGEAVTVTIRRASGEPTRDVEGHLIVPGLAVHEAVGNHLGPRPEDAEEYLDGGRFTVTHMPSGLAAYGTGGPRCRTHLTDLLAALLCTPLDWDRDQQAVISDPAFLQIRDRVDAVRPRWCTRRCDLIPNTPRSRHRCHTCDYVWEDVDGEGEPSVAEAKEMAEDHQCTPDVQILVPGSDPERWVYPYELNDDGTEVNPYRPIVDTPPL